MHARSAIIKSMKTIFKFILKILIMAGVICALPYIISGITVGNIKVALIAAAVIALINVLIKPIVSFITRPLNFLSFGLLGLIINALLFLAVPYFVDGFSIASFWAAFFGALILAAVNWAVSKI